MSVLEKVIRVVAPPLCISCGTEGSALCLACSAASVIPFGGRCWNCGALSPACRTCQQCRYLRGPRCVWVATDYAGVPQELVKVYKFGHQRAAAHSLAGIMAEALEAYCDLDLLPGRNYLVVPVPTATSRVRQRGFDHAALLARTLAGRLGLEYSPVLRRTGQSRQVGAGRTQRLAQSPADYPLHLPQKVKGRNILLVDDVVTTGGTLIAATKSLRAGGAKHVDALVFAKKL